MHSIFKRYIQNSIVNIFLLCIIDWLVVGCKIKANCSHVGPRPKGKMLVGVFLKDPSPYLCYFWRKSLYFLDFDIIF